MWVARNEDAVRCNLFVHKPKRYEQIGMWLDGKESATEYGLLLDSDMFTDVKWEDEPVEIVIDILDKLILKFEILNTQFQANSESVCNTFENFAKKNWNNVDLNFFDYIM